MFLIYLDQISSQASTLGKDQSIILYCDNKNSASMGFALYIDEETKSLEYPLKEITNSNERFFH